MEYLKQMINIIYEDNHLLVVFKPGNIPVQLDSSNDLDLQTMLKNYLKEKYNKKGDAYLGLVHRLDRPVKGIMVFAKTSKAARRLSQQILNNQMKKKYYAIVYNKPVSSTFEDKLLKDETNNIVRVDSKGKDSVLNFKLLKYDLSTNLSLVDINLVTGRSHQIRVQFSSRNYPLYGDQKYNKDAKIGQQIALFSYQLEFDHPITKEHLIYKIGLPNEYPWSIFK